MMLMILSPAKRQRFSNELLSDSALEKWFTRPEWLMKAQKVADLMKAYAPHELARVLRVSDAIAVREAGHFEAWDRKAVYPVAQPAVTTYDGDVYRALDVNTLDEKASFYLKDHLRIISVLYGVLRPFDLIQPHRVSFSTTAIKPDGTDFYHYWKKPIVASLNRALGKTENRVLVNLASQDFVKAVDLESLDGQMITPVFQERRGGVWRVLGLYAKRARGLMARFAAEHAVTDARSLQAFDCEGYTFDEAASGDTVWFFRR